MGIEKVILVNLLSKKNAIDVGSSNIGLRVLQEALNQKGFGNVQLFPETPYTWEESDNGLVERRFTKEIIESVDDWENTVIGFSGPTDDADKLIGLASIVRELDSDVKIVGGGPHFRRQKIEVGEREYFDSVFMALRSRDTNEELIFDAVFDGHGKSFVDYVLSGGNVFSDGVYTRSEELEIIGKGVSKFPDIGFIPPTIAFSGENYVVLNVFFDEFCPNKCGYCAIADNSGGFDNSAMIDKIVKMSEGYKLIGLNIEDSAALKRNDLEPYRRIFNELNSRGIRSYKKMYLDPQDFVGDKYQLRTDFIEEHDIYSIFFGRDCVDANVARKIGRGYAEEIDGKWKRRIRTQEDLDNEKEVFKKLIGDINGGRFTHPVPKFIISYVLTPFDTYDSQKKMIDEAEELELLGEGKVGIHFGILAPYPGTQVKRKFAHLIENPLVFNTHASTWNCWKYELGDQVLFMDEMFQVKRNHINRATDAGIDPIGAPKGKIFYDEMREALDDAYSGKLEKKPWNERTLG